MIRHFWGTFGKKLGSGQRIDEGFLRKVDFGMYRKGGYITRYQDDMTTELVALGQMSNVVSIDQFMPKSIS